MSDRDSRGGTASCLIILAQITFGLVCFFAFLSAFYLAVS